MLAMARRAAPEQRSLRELRFRQGSFRRNPWRAYDDSIDVIEAIIEEEKIECSFRRAGKLKLASKASHVYFGVRQERDLCLVDHFQALCVRNPDLTVVPVLSQVERSAGWRRK